MKNYFMRMGSFWVYAFLLISFTQTSWGEQVQIYYTNDPTLRLEHVKTRIVPMDMTTQQFLDTLNLPPLGLQAVWALATKELKRSRPSDLVVVPNAFHPVGRSADNPWVVTKIAVGG